MSKEPQNKFTPFLKASRSGAPQHDQTGGPASVGEFSARSGRRGKRSDPAFEQVTAYIRKTTHRSIKLALLKEGKDRQFSELVEDLLATWLESTGRT